MKRRRKKATEILKIKHYSHIRSHTLNPADSMTSPTKDSLSKQNTINLGDLSSNLKKYMKKNSRIKTTPKAS